MSDLNKVPQMASIDSPVPSNSSASNYSFSVNRTFYPKPGSALEKTLNHTNGSQGLKRGASSPPSSQTASRKSKAKEEVKNQPKIRDAILNSRRGITPSDTVDMETATGDNEDMFGLFDELGEPGKKD